MARITAVTNQKGGVGKTTTALALAGGLSLQGYKTLLIDTDPQANASFTMNADTEQPGIYELLKGEPASIQHTEQGDIIPSSISLAGADMEFTQTGREYLLRDVIGPIKGKYDYIIIDTPPTLGILTINALAAADDVLIPMGADIYSLQGLGQLYTTINRVKKYCNGALTIAGLLITRYSGRAILSQDLKESIAGTAARIGAGLYETIIREGIAVKEAQARQVSLYTEKSNAANDYLDFISEYRKGL